MMLELYVLASGSRGNAAIIRNASQERSILLDCGIGARTFLAACKKLSVSPDEIESVLITHRHTDHTKGIGYVLRALSRRGCAPVLYTHKSISSRSRHLEEVAELIELRNLPKRGSIDLSSIRVTPFRSRHNVEVSFGFRFEADGDAIGYLTDSGVVPTQAYEMLKGVRILAIESNHDVSMLKKGPYPYHLKRRILGNTGHLSNEQCCSAVESLLHPGLEHVVAMHISEENNTFELPVREIKKVLDAHEINATVQAALPRTPICVK